MANLSASSQNGGPSEDLPPTRIRQGQIDWVPAFEKISQFRMWHFQFRIGASTYLSERVYPNEEERHLAWLTALLKASSLGKNEELARLLELYDRTGVKCDAMLKKLEERYKPAIDLEKQKATEKFLTFTRGRLALTEAIKQLRDCLLEAQKLCYNPDEETIVLKFESLLKMEERPLYRIYLAQDNSERSKQDKTIGVLESLGRDMEAGKGDGGSGSAAFAGGAFGSNRGPGRRDGRSDRRPKRSGFAQNGEEKASKVKTCDRCGLAHCKSLKDGKRESCKAFDKVCHSCNKKGHFSSVCRTAKKDANDKKAAMTVLNVEKQEDCPF